MVKTACGLSASGVNKIKNEYLCLLIGFTEMLTVYLQMIMEMKRCVYNIAVMAVTLSLSGCALFKGSETVVAEPEPVQANVSDITGGITDEEERIKLTKALLNGEWIIWEVRGENIKGDERPYINFSVSEGRFYGSNGCNIINGDFRIEKDKHIILENLLSTQRYCPEAQHEVAINSALGEVSTYMIERKGNEYYLGFVSKDNTRLLTLRKHNMDYLNGAWRIVSVNGKKCDDESVQLMIDIPELRIHGNTGCNILNGTLYIDPDKEDAIQFQQIVTTRMACEDIQRETAFLIALEEVDVCHKGKDNTAIMYDKDGNVVLILKKIDDK